MDKKSKSKSRSKSKSKSIDKSKDSKKSIKKPKTKKEQENNKNDFENLPIPDTSSMELNQLINPGQINNMNNNNPNSPKSEILKYYEQLNQNKKHDISIIWLT